MKEKDASLTLVAKIGYLEIYNEKVRDLLVPVAKGVSLQPASYCEHCNQRQQHDVGRGEA